MATLNPPKGTVTPVDSLFSAAEAENASKRIQSTIADHQKKLDLLNSFIADNSALSKLLRQLPNNISHDIMVPFGSAAFFPGKLIHTNELLVLLGDGYYAERTAKQTAEILKRREKAMEEQREALKGMVLDLEAEAKFFDYTANEAKEGVVEIREEYIEDSQSNGSESGSNTLISAKANSSKLPYKEDEDYAQIMARLDELEKEEREMGSTSGSDEDEDAETGLGNSTWKDNINDGENESSENFKSRGQEMLYPTAAKSVGGSSCPQLANLSSISDVNSVFTTKDESVKSNVEQPHSTHKPPLPPTPDENLQKLSAVKLEDSSDNSASQTSGRGFDRRKAFTGEVIEHGHGLPSNQPSRSNAGDQRSKPVSRFKMQRGNR